MRNSFNILKARIRANLLLVASNMAVFMIQYDFKHPLPFHHFGINQRPQQRQQPNIAETNIIKYTNKKHLKQAAVPYIFDIASLNPYRYVIYTACVCVCCLTN